MSGRSALVRAEKEQQADEHYLRNRYGDYQWQEEHLNEIDEYTPHNFRRVSVESLPSTSRHQSFDHALPLDPSVPARYRRHETRQQFYRPPLRKQPRPIIIASAIDKSDFRAHLDGLTDSVRDRLGRLVGVGKERKDKRPETRMAYRRASVTMSPTPPINAVPSLMPSIPSPQRVLPFAAASSTGTQGRPGSYERPEAVIGVFRGGSQEFVRRWKSHLGAPELEDPNGDTLIQLCSNRHHVKPTATFRVQSRILRDAGCTVLTDELRDTLVPGVWYDSDGPYHGQESQPESSSSGRSHPIAHSSSTSPDSDLPLTPGIRSGREPTYKLRLSYPGDRIGLDATTWLLTTRNFLAVLYDAGTLCGTSLFDALYLLSTRVRDQPGWLHASTNRTAFIMDYLKRHHFDDPRASPATAASLLAFSELGQVRWKAGYKEAFVHCVGLFNASQTDILEWKQISPRSRIFIENAALEVEPRVRRAQALISDFSFPELWPPKFSPKAPIRIAFEQFRQWLCQYCAVRTRVGTWPPPSDHRGVWLTRERLVLLRELFASLFDYLVDRDAIFDTIEGGDDAQGRTIVSRSGQFFRADLGVDAPVTSMLTRFDDAHGFAHLPSPYPLLPDPVSNNNASMKSGHSKTPSAASSSVLASKSSNPGALAATPISSEELLQRKAIAYSSASNLLTSTLSTNTRGDDAPADFNAFERGDRLDTVDPRSARLGRWLLVYAALQALSPVAVDTPGLRYSDGTPTIYHLNASLKGIVPWRASDDSNDENGSAGRGDDAWDASDAVEPRPDLFHPFVAPKRWPLASPRARPGAHKPIMWGTFGDGRARVEAAAPKSAEASPKTPKDEWSRTPTSQPTTPLSSHPPPGQRPALALRPTRTDSAPPLPPLPPAALARGLSQDREKRPGTASGSVDGPIRSASAGRAAVSKFNPDLASSSSPSSPVAGHHGGGMLLGSLRQNDTQGLLRREGGRGGLAAVATAAAGPGLALGSDEKVEVPTARERIELERARIRKRRAEVHGFTDYKPPSGW